MELGTIITVAVLAGAFLFVSYKAADRGKQERGGYSRTTYQNIKLGVRRFFQRR